MLSPSDNQIIEVEKEMNEFYNSPSQSSFF